MTEKWAAISQAPWTKTEKYLFKIRKIVPEVRNADLVFLCDSAPESKPLDSYTSFLPRLRKILQQERERGRGQRRRWGATKPGGGLLRFEAKKRKREGRIYARSRHVRSGFFYYFRLFVVGWIRSGNSERTAKYGKHSYRKFQNLWDTYDRWIVAVECGIQKGRSNSYVPYPCASAPQSYLINPGKDSRAVARLVMTLHYF